MLDAGALNASGDFATVLGAFSTMNAQQCVAAMNAASGQNYSAFSSAGIAATEACDVACDTTAPGRWGAWVGALGGFGVVGGTVPAGTLTYSLGGFAAGIDRRVAAGTPWTLTARYHTTADQKTVYAAQRVTVLRDEGQTVDVGSGEAVFGSLVRGLLGFNKVRDSECLKPSFGN